MILFFKFAVLFILCFYSPSITSTDDFFDCFPWENDPYDCKCNATHCDNTTKVDWCPEEGLLLMYLTSDGPVSTSGARFRPLKTYFDGPTPSADAQFTITVDPCTTYQTMFGFGGALTDAAAIMISCLPESAKIFLMNNYFNCEVGLAYNMIRINVGACDFSPYLYTYCDSDTSTCSSDPQLSCFNLNYIDTDYKIPLLRLAQQISCTCLNIKIAAWNAPKWMTTGEESKNAIIGHEQLMKDECFEAWANYYIKIIEAFEFCNLNCSLTVSVGNEPFVALVSLGFFTTESYEKFLVKYLCPKLRNLTCAKPIRILVNDDQTPFLLLIEKMLLNSDTKSCIDCIGTHFYLDFQDTNLQLQATTEQHKLFYLKHPDKCLWRTESTIAHIDGAYNKPDWDKAAKIAIDIIITFNGNVQAYLDWNLVLNLLGGPNWQDNYCYAAVLVDCDKGEFYKQILFYVLGHFSKCIIPGKTVRVDIVFEAKDSSVVGTSIGVERQNLFHVAFKVNVENCTRLNLVVIILNTQDREVKGNLCVAGYNCAIITVPAKSIISIVSTLPSDLKCSINPSVSPASPFSSKFSRG